MQQVKRQMENIQVGTEMALLTTTLGEMDATPDGKVPPKLRCPTNQTAPLYTLGTWTGIYTM